MAQDQQLKVLDLHAAATPNERAQQRPERKVEKRQGHYADPPNPSANGATRLLVPFKRLLERLAPHLARPDNRIAGLHVYTFNDIERAERGRHETIARHL